MTELERYIAEHIKIPPGYELTDIIENPYAVTTDQKIYILTFKPKPL